MGKRYDQLDPDDRIEISHLMGRNASTISRELRRNSLPRGEYKPASADRIALSRRWRLSKIARRSITFDNGSEFARHQNLSRTLDMKTWFCDPHSPRQCGSIENANGVLQRDLPRKTDLADYSQQDIYDIVWAINTTPRKCLGFRIPAEAFLTHHRCCI